MKMKLVKIALLAAMCFGAPLLSPAMAQQKAPARQTKEPNIMGVWEIYPDPFAGDENTFLELEAPNGGPKLKAPYANQWKAVRAERNAKLKAGTPLVDPSTLCIPEGMPAIMGAIFPFQILQTPGQVTVLAEFLTQTRRIYLDTPMLKPEDNSPSYYGFSVGRWEGDTLVVTTRGVSKDVQFFEIPHSEDMTITERIRLTGPGLLEDQITIDDPKMLLQPYRFTYGYKRNDQYRIMEYFCERQDPLITLNKDGTVSMKVYPSKQ
jgi:hypothetical protein